MDIASDTNAACPAADLLARLDGELAHARAELQAAELQAAELHTHAGLQEPHAADARITEYRDRFAVFAAMAAGIGLARAPHGERI